MVRSVDVHKRFGRLEVLRGVSLDVARGEVVVIIGPSGSGKTTFLRCINHLERVDAGRIYKLTQAQRAASEERDWVWRLPRGWWN